MSEENVENFKRGADAWNRDDYDAWIDQFDPEVEWFALMEVYRGHAGARQAWESFKGDMKLTVRFDDIRDLGESVLALGKLKGIGHTTGLNVGGELAQLLTYRDGKVVSARDFGSHADGLAAAGLPPLGQK
jgi:ketosteroid isomerase-like protein